MEMLKVTFRIGIIIAVVAVLLKKSFKNFYYILKYMSSDIFYKNDNFSVFKKNKTH